jgi:phosphatidylglycerol:prolipoprotein diacylglycerol transferase
MLVLLDPVAIAIGGIKIHWYGIILGTAALAGLLFAIREGKRFLIPPDFFMDLLLIGVPSAIIGARIYYVAFQWEDYQNNLSEIYKIWHGGIAIHGALIGAVIGAIIYTRIKKVNFWRIADIAAPGLIIGQMIGRWGNFVNQEAHGGEVERSFLSDTLHLPDWIVNHMEIDGAFYHPTFLYESIWNLLGLMLLMWLRRMPFLRAGELFLSYFVWYSIGRFYIEGLRTDSLAFHGPDWLASLINVLWAPMNVLFDAGELPEGGGNVRIAQLIGICIIIAAFVLMYIRRRQGYAETRYSDPIIFEAIIWKNGSGTIGNGSFSPPPTIAEQDDIESDNKESDTKEQENQEPVHQERIPPGKPFI